MVEVPNFNTKVVVYLKSYSTARESPSIVLVWG